MRIPFAVNALAQAPSGPIPARVGTPVPTFQAQPQPGWDVVVNSRSPEVELNWNEWIRSIRRRRSTAFTMAVIVNIVVLSQEEPAVWVGLLVLFPLALLLFTGLHLFVLPYATRRRSGRRTDPLTNRRDSMT